MHTIRSSFSYIILSFILTLLPCTLQHPQTKSSYEKCHSAPGVEALEYLATKRPYHFNTSEDHVYTPQGCSPVKLWYFGRHGTRYPGDEDILAMQDNLPRLHKEILDVGNTSQLCPEALKYFSTWKPRTDLNISTESYLHSQGYQELSAIASRFISRYPSLFPSQFSNSTYFFKFTDAQRTNASAHAFASSIFGEDLPGVWFPHALSKDPVLKFYSLCRKWEEEVDKNPEANLEHDLFLRSVHMNLTIHRVSRRLGLDRNLTLDELTILYTTCAFETAWNNDTLSQWCTLFGIEDLGVMEYREDLEYYYKDGYGFKVNYEQACVPFQDAIHFFDEYPGEQPHTILEYRKTQAYFSHSGATVKMFARLGLFNDTKIKADNYESVKDHYEFKTSHIDTMGTNMAFVMYKCNSTEVKERHQIGLFVQEKPTPFPGCGGKAFCPYEEFRGNLNKFTEHCNLDDICKV